MPDALPAGGCIVRARLAAGAFATGRRCQTCGGSGNTTDRGPDAEGPECERCDGHGWHPTSIPARAENDVRMPLAEGGLLPACPDCGAKAEWGLTRAPACPAPIHCRTCLAAFADGGAA